MAPGGWAGLAANWAGRQGRWLAARIRVLRDVLGGTFGRMLGDHMSLVAAGCAFWATLALFPGLSALVSVYGLLLDPRRMVAHLDVLSGLLPPDVYYLIASRMRILAAHHVPALSTGLVLGALVTFWSVANGIRSVLAALNLAYRATERRGFLRVNATVLVVTLAAIVVAVLGMALLVGLPPLLHELGVPLYRRAAIHGLSLAVVLGLVLVTLVLLYRLGPSRPRHLLAQRRWHLAVPGAVLATLLWLAAAEMFSWYVRRVALYHATYGPLAAAAGVLMWFYVTAYVVLLGAELNAQLELRAHGAPRDAVADGLSRADAPAPTPVVGEHAAG